MNMIFKRNKTQRYIENKVDCREVEKWLSYKQKVVELVLDSTDEGKLRECMLMDAESYYLKGLITFCEAINGIKKQRHTWSIVKFYYSTFYSLRADILLSGFFLLRCGSLFYGRASKGTQLKKFSPKKASGDHQATTYFALKLHKDQIRIDLIQDMLIDDILPYLWLMKQRERVHYQLKDFLDPEIDKVLTEPVDYINSGGEVKLFSLYDSDEYQLYCADKQHACVAIPYNKLKTLQKEFSSQATNVFINESLKEHLNKLIDLNAIHAVMAK